MNAFPREPNPGDRISAQLIRDIIRCLRRNTPLAGANVRLRVSPNGTFIDGTPGGSVSSSSRPDNGCWKIGTDAEEGSSQTRKAFLNRFFAIGGKLCEHEDKVFLDEFVMQGDLPEPEEGEEQPEYTDEDKPFVALVVSMDPETFGEASVEGYKEFEDMQEEADDPTKFLKPLYKLTHDGGVVIDFRNLPLASSGEGEVESEE